MRITQRVVRLVVSRLVGPTFDNSTRVPPDRCPARIIHESACRPDPIAPEPSPPTGKPRLRLTVAKRGAGAPGPTPPCRPAPRFSCDRDGRLRRVSGAMGSSLRGDLRIIRAGTGAATKHTKQQNAASRLHSQNRNSGRPFDNPGQGMPAMMIAVVSVKKTKRQSRRAPGVFAPIASTRPIRTVTLAPSIVTRW